MVPQLLPWLPEGNNDTIRCVDGVQEGEVHWSQGKAVSRDTSLKSWSAAVAAVVLLG